MQNFEYYNPTRIVFGRGSIGRIDDLVPADATVMLTYGGGSIKANGVYDQVRGALGDRALIEFGGITPNPSYEHCMEAVEVVRAKGVDFLLAAGGGSVLDATKFISAAALYDGDDPWIFIEKRGEVLPEAALPIGAVLTLPATGSEMNPIAVITREERQDKRAFVSERVQPQFSILDPEVTFSLPREQVRNGVVDAFVHTIEQYITYPADAPLQDRQAEAVLATLIEEGPKTLAQPQDYNARANLMWCATTALNRSLGCGVPQDWATHMTGHELTAFYGVAHAESLAAVLPSLWRVQKETKKAKLAQYARRVWGVDEADDDTAADQAIARTAAFFESVGMPVNLQAYDIPADEAAERIAARFTDRGVVWGENRDLTPDRIAEIGRAHV